MKKLLIIGIFLIMPIQSIAQVVFTEQFETGSFPYSFDSYIGDGVCNEIAAVDEGGNRGVVWRVIFKTTGGGAEGDCGDLGFGFSEQQNWPTSNTFYMRFSVRYGDSEHPYTWDTARRSHELKFPDIGRSEDRIIGKHRGNGNRGYFNLYTPQPPGVDEKNHLISETHLVSNVWYNIQFMLQNNGASGDVVKLWFNNEDPDNPSYSYTSTGNLFDSAGWNPDSPTPWKWTYRNHAVATEQYIYFDDFEVSTAFIRRPQRPRSFSITE